jgi:3-hydroxybutyryl-CoA dehydrogenase
MSIIRIGIVGEGKMGTNLFQYIAGFPFEMRWVGSSEANIEKISRGWSKKVLRGLNAGIITATDAERMNRAVITNDLSVLRDCDLIIETISEHVIPKQELFMKLDSIAPSTCILATNSSSILPSVLIPSAGRKPNTIGLHFFYPVALKNIVEVVVHEGISETTVRTAKEFITEVGRNYLLQTEETAFLLNRVFLEFQLEAWRITEEGLMTPSQTDQLIRERFFPLGAFECFDAVGIDVMLPSIRNYTLPYSDKDRYLSLLTALERMQDAGKPGLKPGQGFLTHDPGTPADQPSLDTIPSDVLKTAEDRLRNALEDATGRLLKGAAFTTEQFLQGFREYLGF